MELKAFAKINLSLDILGCREDGYHNISSLMQDIGLFDVIKIENCLTSGTKYNELHCFINGHDVHLCTNVETIPINDDNLAIKAARVLLETFDATVLKELSIYIDKRLPVAAGIAGGSGNAAVTMLGINALAGYPYSLRELMEMGVKVGADVPFSLMMNAKKNSDQLAGMRGIEESSTAAMTGGIGDIVEPVEPIHKYVIMANPGIAVSTKAAYEAIDALKDSIECAGMFTNQLEEYTLKNYPEAAALKQAMDEQLNADLVLMSGSGPTMVAYYSDKALSEEDFEKLKKDNWFKASWKAWLTETGVL